MSDIKSEPTPDQAKQVQLEQQQDAGEQSPRANVNPRNGRETTTAASKDSAIDASEQPSN